MKIRNTFLHRKITFLVRNILRIIHTIFVFLDWRKFDRWSLPHAACVLIEDKEGKVLAVSRKDDSTKFGLPGGKKEDNETDLETALRELKEETGISLLWSELEKIYEGIDDSEYWTICYRYVNRYNTNRFYINPGKFETGIVKFINREQILNGPFSGYNQKVFDLIDKL